MPQRIQRKRTAGWKMPENTVYVGRPGKWGNPFTGPNAAEMFREVLFDISKASDNEVRYKIRLMRDTIFDLRDKNLACWCKPGESCHADALLELANQPLP